MVLECESTAANRHFDFFKELAFGIDGLVQVILLVRAHTLK